MRLAPSRDSKDFPEGLREARSALCCWYLFASLDVGVVGSKDCQLGVTHEELQTLKTCASLGQALLAAAAVERGEPTKANRGDVFERTQKL